MNDKMMKVVLAGDCFLVALVVILFVCYLGPITGWVHAHEKAVIWLVLVGAMAFLGAVWFSGRKQR